MSKTCESKEKPIVIALAGNPNVGKSTIFNSLTGMRQHTGNWAGKTVSNAEGFCKNGKTVYKFVDLPGTYSLLAHSAEEAVARDFICFEKPDAVIVVCDATCLVRNMNLVLQCIEISQKVIICVNMLDEAKRKNISVDLKGLSEKTGVPVIGAVGRDKHGTKKLLNAIENALCKNYNPISIKYDDAAEEAIKILEPALCGKNTGMNNRWLSLRLIDMDESLKESIKEHAAFDIAGDTEILQAVITAKNCIGDKSDLNDKIVSALLKCAEDICADTVYFDKNAYDISDRKIDRVLTSRIFGYPAMLLLLALIFWLTISLSNYPSALLSGLFFSSSDKLRQLLGIIGINEVIQDMLINGAFRVLAWVVSVMLPPMAIFFPLFTLLEDSGYLPRIAYNLDKPFKCCNACGKQALTMAMGFGCNAAAVTGCRIIDSPRERLIAIITNSFVPCNGRFPALIAMITMFFVSGLPFGSVFSALLLTAVILLSVLMTFFASWILSKTVLRGVASSFTLELPPYRMPQIKEVIVRSVLDRTLFVLARAAVVAAPAGVIIWLLANININGQSLLVGFAALLEPFGRLLGLDGAIAAAFILGLPANEIVIPIMLMIYLSKGSLIQYESLGQLKTLLLANGWSVKTAVCFCLFSLMHWPCSTALMTIKKETGSLKWPAVSILLPFLTGTAACVVFNLICIIF